MAEHRVSTLPGKYCDQLSAVSNSIESKLSAVQNSVEQN